MSGGLSHLKKKKENHHEGTPRRCDHTVLPVLLTAAQAPFQIPRKRAVDHVVNAVFSLCVECGAACMHRTL